MINNFGYWTSIKTGRNLIYELLQSFKPCYYPVFKITGAFHLLRWTSFHAFIAGILYLWDKIVLRGCWKWFGAFFMRTIIQVALKQFQHVAKIASIYVVSVFQCFSAGDSCLVVELACKTKLRPKETEKLK